ncbi:hypothetical protein EMGR_006262 [Emarellia grisea]
MALASQCSRGATARFNARGTINKELIKYINKLTERGLFASHEMLWNFAKELTGKKLGKHWPGRFLKRH